jgi:hypothetical protein
MEYFAGKKRFPNVSPLKAELKARKIRYWMLKRALSISMPKLSHMLNGIDHMPADVERKIREYIVRFDEARDQRLKEEVDRIIGK